MKVNEVQRSGENLWAEKKLMSKSLIITSDWKGAKMKRRTIEDLERHELLWDKGSAIGGFKPLEEDTHFTDVTLACGDGQVCLALFCLSDLID